MVFTVKAKVFFRFYSTLLKFFAVFKISVTVKIYPKKVPRGVKIKGDKDMKKVIITEKNKGLLFKNGKYVKLLDAGKYRVFGDSEIEIVSLDCALLSNKCNLDTLLKDQEIANQTVIVDVKDEELALHYVDGKFHSVVGRGKHAYWNTCSTHEFKIVNISSPVVEDEISDYVFSKILPAYYTKIEVQEFQKARLLFNGKFVKVLDSGTYYFWKNGVKVEASTVDTRLTQMDICGQEILTLDKVSIRVNLVVNYKITDFVKIFTEINDFSEQLRVFAQLALREYVGKRKLDEILENKEEISNFIFNKLKEKEKDYFVEVFDSGVKDIILPGEIREIMNTVLVAEKKAQANVITRREEVASTRSLLNTAKLMEENPTLYKLKELEYVERICENVGHITLNGNGDILTQLGGVLSRFNKNTQ